jgi:hypothetical protein
MPTPCASTWKTSTSPSIHSDPNSSRTRARLAGSIQAWASAFRRRLMRDIRRGLRRQFAQRPNCTRTSGFEPGPLTRYRCSSLTTPGDVLYDDSAAIEANLYDANSAPGYESNSTANTYVQRMFRVGAFRSANLFSQIVDPSGHPFVDRVRNLRDEKLEGRRQHRGGRRLPRIHAPLQACACRRIMRRFPSDSFPHITGERAAERRVQMVNRDLVAIRRIRWPSQRDVDAPIDLTLTPERQGTRAEGAPPLLPPFLQPRVRRLRPSARRVSTSALRDEARRLDQTGC